ncbi:MAG TPA: hypothetical protein VHQ90_11010 [Thermoanaerobaculia bacterium]|nr:hypothetical protein [Thermoanaerobaculia bacterium]
MVVTSIGLEEQRALAERYLVPHALEAEILSESESIRRSGVTHFVASLSEIVELTIHSAPAFSALTVGFSLSFGLTLGKLFGKVVETGASELGKDLYHWFKELVQGAIRKSKHSNLERRLPEPRPEIRFTLNTVLYEGSPTPVELRIHVLHEFGRWQQDTKTYVDNGVSDEIVLGRLRELAAVILPLTSELLEERRAGKELPDHVLIQTLLEPDQPDRYEWSVGLGFHTHLFVGQDQSFNVRSDAGALDEAKIRRVYRRVRRQADRARRRGSVAAPSP